MFGVFFLIKTLNKNPDPKAYFLMFLYIKWLKKTWK